MLAFFGLLQWFLFSSAVFNLSNVRAGAFLDFGFCLSLGIVSWHFNYWEEQLVHQALEAKYLGVSF
jgi:hypothetical protein